MRQSEEKKEKIVVSRVGAGCGGDIRRSVLQSAATGRRTKRLNVSYDFPPAKRYKQRRGILQGA